MSFFPHLDGLIITRVVRRRNHYHPFFQASITLLRRYNVVYVENSKVGCTKVKKYLLEIDNFPRRWDELIGKEVHIHNKDLTGMVGAANLTCSALSRILRDPHYFRFGFVRNPYDRLLSAYKDKILAPQNASDKTNYVPVACRIKATIAGGDHRRVDLNKTPVSFPEFVSYVSRQRPYDMDRHWFHQHLTMWHPFCKFDFIGRFESFPEDLRKVLTKVGAPQAMIDSVERRDNASFRTSRKFYDESLADLVHRKFRKDFDLYGYDPKSWVGY